LYDAGVADDDQPGRGEHQLSSDLETIVRPSQLLDYAPARVYYTAGQIGVPMTRLQIGRSGQGKTFNGSASYSASFYMTKYASERSQFGANPDEQRFYSFTGKFGEGQIGNVFGS